MSETPRPHWALTGARAIAGILVAAAAVAGAVLAVAAPWPTVTTTPLAVDVVPAAAETVIACDGPYFIAGRTLGTGGGLTVAATGEPLAVGGEGELSRTELQTLDVDDSPGTVAFSSPLHEGVVTPLAAASSIELRDPDASGFTVDACRPALFESWIVGGSTETGTNALLVLANPGDVTATVDITVFGGSGEVAPPGGTGVTIAARTQRVIPLAGLSGGEESPVLRISASGAPVRASLQTTLMRTLDPVGIDQQSAIAAPAKTQVVPGVTVVVAPGETGASETATVLRLLAPTAEGEATVTVTAVGRTSPAIAPSTVPLESGIPTEVDLGGLAAGSYTVTVEASVPLVAAAWETTGFGAGADLAWLTSAPALDRDALVAVPSGPSPTLTLANTGDADVSVELRHERGPGGDATVVVPAHGSASIGLAGGSAWTIAPSGAVHAQITYTGPGASAGFAAWPSDAATGAVRVYP